jgi:hypothetical protein
MKKGAFFGARRMGKTGPGSAGKLPRRNGKPLEAYREYALLISRTAASS